MIYQRLGTILELTSVKLPDKKTAKAPYGKEIEMLRKQAFNPEVFAELL
ncbi:hypothetical protein [Enterococcus cecorum]